MKTSFPYSNRPLLKLLKITKNEYQKLKKSGVVTLRPLSQQELSDSVIQETVAFPPDFHAKNGDLFLVCTLDEGATLWMGLGKEEINSDQIRTLFAKAGKSMLKHRVLSVVIDLSAIPKQNRVDLAYSALEGLLLGNYAFTRYFGLKKKNEAQPFLENIYFSDLTATQIKSLEDAVVEARAVDLAKNLINANAEEVHSDFFFKVISDYAKQNHLKARFLRKKELEREGCDLILAVNQGSHREPLMAILEYQGEPDTSSLNPIVIVGKGVTFDTGGLNLKPTGSIETMRSDMSGAATAFAAFTAIVEKKLPINITIILPITDNAIGNRSFCPGDVYSSYKGITVEIGNTDAEGRLILADALAWAEKHLNPSLMIDLATLTGAMSISLGAEAAGLFTLNDDLAEQIAYAGIKSGDRVWRLPMYPEYKELLKSDIADISNVGGRAAGSISAAWFLKEFVDSDAWAHLDIAGVAHLSEERRFYSKGASGFGVRLLLRFLEQAKN